MLKRLIVSLKQLSCEKATLQWKKGPDGIIKTNVSNYIWSSCSRRQLKSVNYTIFYDYRLIDPYRIAAGIEIRAKKKLASVDCRKGMGQLVSDWFVGQIVFMISGGAWG